MPLSNPPPGIAIVIVVAAIRARPLKQPSVAGFADGVWGPLHTHHSHSHTHTRAAGSLARCLALYSTRLLVHDPRRAARRLHHGLCVHNLESRRSDRAATPSPSSSSLMFLFVIRQAKPSHPSPSPPNPNPVVRAASQPASKQAIPLLKKGTNERTLNSS